MVIACSKNRLYKGDFFVALMGLLLCQLLESHGIAGLAVDADFPVQVGACTVARATH